MKPVLGLIAAGVVALIVWMIWVPSESSDPRLETDHDIDARTTEGPLLRASASPPSEAGRAGDRAKVGSSDDADAATADTPAEADLTWAIEVYATDPDGRPVQGVRIADGRKAQWETDDEGYVEVQVSALPYSVQITAPSGWWRAKTPVQITATRLDVVVQPTVAFDGLVLGPSGHGVPATKIRVEWFEADGRQRQLSPAVVSDSEGRFRLEVPRAPGRYGIWAFAPQGSWDRIPRHRVAWESVHADELRNLELRFDEGEILEGTVVDPEGNQQREGAVSLTPSGGVHRKSRSTEIDPRTGRFRFVGLDPGPYWVRFSPKEQTEIKYPWHKAVAPTADAQIRGVRVGVVSGRVVGAAVGGVELTWYRRVRGNEWFSHDANVRTGKGGTFELSGVSGGDTRLYARTGTRCALLDNVAVPSAGLEVLLEEGKSIRGRFEKPSGPHRKPRSVGVSQDGLVIWSVLPSDGSFSIGPLPPGRWKLHWLGNGRTGTFEDYGEVESGAADVVLEYPKGH